ncbi:MAG: 1-deoxy-D-xylulose-5-phosphate synthase [Prevotella sp.]|nr:1-deoxy-D-xylulose-5-phosphate synthase [Prevotella sp.]
MKLLDDIIYPSDLKKLNVEQLPQVCGELRNFIIEQLADNPGHLGSSLGTIELTVALHYVYDTPKDKLVWDVGHQAYAHKILTGRRKEFSTNRKFGGLRPFPSPLESEYDTFACGHTSNSISAALGMAVAAKKLHEHPEHVVAIIGDGAMSGGLAYEGLNNASQQPNDMLIVLNDNNMSIDCSVGGMRDYLLHLNTNKRYNKVRFRLSNWLHDRGVLDDKRKKAIIRLNNAVKSFISQQQNIFEGMDIRYFGPIDGHNVVEMVRVLREIKEMTGPKILHLHTRKGKGYKPAEENPTIFHAPGIFDPDTGECLKRRGKDEPLKYQEVFGKTLLELARKNERIIGVTPAMPTGCSMNILMEKMPARAFDVGIAEGHAVTFSAGMAKEGLVPFCNIYSSFAQRAYDNIIHDVAILSLPVVLCLDRAGIVGEDGATHHGAFDLAYLRPIPNITISSPMDERELRHLMYTAQLPNKGPFVIRYPRGKGELTDWQCPMEEIQVGTGRKLTDGEDVAILSLGPIGNTVQRAIKRCSKSVAHYDMRFLKPLDEALLTEVGQKFSRIITIEDGVRNGGLGSAVTEWMQDHGCATHVERMGLPDEFVEHGSVPELMHTLGLDEEGILEKLEQAI